MIERRELFFWCGVCVVSAAICGMPNVFGAPMDVEYQGAHFVIAPRSSPTPLMAAAPEMPRLFIDPALLPRDAEVITQPKEKFKRVCRPLKSCVCRIKLLKVRSECGAVRTIKRRICKCKNRKPHITKKAVSIGCGKKVIRTHLQVPMQCELVPIKNSQRNTTSPEMADHSSKSPKTTEEIQ